MENRFEKGFAFICEGDTEKVFYYRLLSYLCEKHRAKIKKIQDKDDHDIKYLLTYNGNSYLIKMQIVGTVTQVPFSGKWFVSQCLSKHRSEVPEWIVFLCYDTDSYSSDVSKFQKDDWKILRKNLRGAEEVIDISASAEIEDALLEDLKGICRYYDIPEPDMPLLGKTGKAKLRGYLRKYKAYYHPGDRAQDLICSLDMQTIIDKSTLPLSLIEDTIFK